jgi:peptidoglycan/LPS O-acetylase OafA/YrhL
MLIMNRIKYLDGLRGIAILLVISHHAFTRWTFMLPYKNEYTDFIVFHTGWLGVQLFFMISGFVILMTLEKCENFHEFIKKRWLRLFPAMLIASLISYFSAFYFVERTTGIPQLNDFFSGLLFIEPTWINTIFNIDSDVLEGGFWSLFVEVKFYCIFGILYFLFGQNKAIGVISALFILAFLTKIISQTNETTLAINNIMNGMSFIYFGWFAIGALVYLYTKSRNIYLLYQTFFLSIISIIYTAISHQKPIMVLCSSIFVLLFFLIPVFSKEMQGVFKFKVFYFIGFVSYPLYLIHENMMISLIIKLNNIFPQIHGLLLPILPILFIVFISYLIAQYLEPILSRNIKRLLF